MYRVFPQSAELQITRSTVLNDIHDQKNLIQLTMLLHGEGLLKVAHEVTTNVMHLRPLLEHKHYAQHNERGR